MLFPPLNLRPWQIQSVFFKIHRHFLTGYSPILENMWGSGSSTSNNGEGSSDDNPVVLHGDDPQDFSCLLQIFYPRQLVYKHALFCYSLFLGRSPGSAVSLKAVQWCSVLAIATKYDMEIIRQRSIQELKIANPPLDPIAQIVAARKYDCHELAETAMEELVKSMELLSIDDIVKLSPEDLHRWIVERDKLREAHIKAQALEMYTTARMQVREAKAKARVQVQEAQAHGSKCRRCSSSLHCTRCRA